MCQKIPRDASFDLYDQKRNHQAILFFVEVDLVTRDGEQLNVVTCRDRKTNELRKLLVLGESGGKADVLVVHEGLHGEDCVSERGEVYILEPWYYGLVE